MSKAQQNRRNKLKLARLEIVAKLYKRCYSVREIRAEVMKRLDIPTYSTATVQKDIKTLLAEWRAERIEDMDAALQLELERIDETVKELWAQWEKSKEDYVAQTRSQKGSPKRDKKTGEQSVEIYQTEQTRRDVVGLGNPAYIMEIRMQLAERRKLLGLYAPEKKDVSGSLSFSSLLIESGMLEEAEREISAQSAQ